MKSTLKSRPIEQASQKISLSFGINSHFLVDSLANPLP
jgi:hypothetical protein